MEKEYTFEFYGTKQQLLNKISSNILDNNSSNTKTFYIGEYMIYVTNDKIEFGIQRGGHSGGYWYIPAIEEFEDHLVLSGKIRYIGPEDNRGKASKVIGEIFFVLFIILLSPILLLFKIYELIDWIVKKISKKPKPITTEGKLLDLMVNKLGCIKK